MKSCLFFSKSLAIVLLAYSLLMMCDVCAAFSGMNPMLNGSPNHRGNNNMGRSGDNGPLEESMMRGVGAQQGANSSPHQQGNVPSWQSRKSQLSSDPTRPSATQYTESTQYREAYIDSTARNQPPEPPPKKSSHSLSVDPSKPKSHLANDYMDFVGNSKDDFSQQQQLPQQKSASSMNSGFSSFTSPSRGTRPLFAENQPLEESMKDAIGVDSFYKSQNTLTPDANRAKSMNHNDRRPRDSYYTPSSSQEAPMSHSSLSVNPSKPETSVSPLQYTESTSTLNNSGPPKRKSTNALSPNPGRPASLSLEDAMADSFTTTARAPPRKSRNSLSADPPVQPLAAPLIGAERQQQRDVPKEPVRSRNSLSSDPPIETLAPPLIGENAKPDDYNRPPAVRREAPVQKSSSSLRPDGLVSPLVAPLIGADAQPNEPRSSNEQPPPKSSLNLGFSSFTAPSRGTNPLIENGGPLEETMKAAVGADGAQQSSRQSSRNTLAPDPSKPSQSVMRRQDEPWREEAKRSASQLSADQSRPASPLVSPLIGENMEPNVYEESRDEPLKSKSSLNLGFSSFTKPSRGVNPLRENGGPLEETMKDAVGADGMYGPSEHGMRQQVRKSSNSLSPDPSRVSLEVDDFAPKDHYEYEPPREVHKSKNQLSADPSKPLTHLSIDYFEPDSHDMSRYEERAPPKSKASMTSGFSSFTSPSRGNVPLKENGGPLEETMKDAIGAETESFYRPAGRDAYREVPKSRNSLSVDPNRAPLALDDFQPKDSYTEEPTREVRKSSQSLSADQAKPVSPLVSPLIGEDAQPEYDSQRKYDEPQKSKASMTPGFSSYTTPSRGNVPLNQYGPLEESMKDAVGAGSEGMGALFGRGTNEQLPKSANSISADPLKPTSPLNNDSDYDTFDRPVSKSEHSLSADATKPASSLLSPLIGEGAYPETSSSRFSTEKSGASMRPVFTTFTTPSRGTPLDNSDGPMEEMMKDAVGAYDMFGSPVANKASHVASKSTNSLSADPLKPSASVNDDFQPRDSYARESFVGPRKSSNSLSADPLKPSSLVDDESQPIDSYADVPRYEATKSSRSLSADPLKPVAPLLNEDSVLIDSYAEEPTRHAARSSRSLSADPSMPTTKVLNEYTNPEEYFESEYPREAASKSSFSLSADPHKASFLNEDAIPKDSYASESPGRATKSGNSLEPDSSDPVAPFVNEYTRPEDFYGYETDSPANLIGTNPNKPALVPGNGKKMNDLPPDTEANGEPGQKDVFRSRKPISADPNTPVSPPKYEYTEIGAMSGDEPDSMDDDRKSGGGGRSDRIQIKADPLNPIASLVTPYSETETSDFSDASSLDESPEPTAPQRRSSPIMADPSNPLSPLVNEYTQPQNYYYQESEAPRQVVNAEDNLFDYLEEESLLVLDEEGGDFALLSRWYYVSSIDAAADAVFRPKASIASVKETGDLGQFSRRYCSSSVVDIEPNDTMPSGKKTESRKKAESTARALLQARLKNEAKQRLLTSQKNAEATARALLHTRLAIDARARTLATAQAEAAAHHASGIELAKKGELTARALLEARLDQQRKERQRASAKQAEATARSLLQTRLQMKENDRIPKGSRVDKSFLDQRSSEAAVPESQPQSPLERVAFEKKAESVARALLETRLALEKKAKGRFKVLLRVRPKQLPKIPAALGVAPLALADPNNMCVLGELPKYRKWNSNPSVRFGRGKVCLGSIPDPKEYEISTPDFRLFDESTEESPQDNDVNGVRAIGEDSSSNRVTADNVSVTGYSGIPSINGAQSDSRLFKPVAVEGMIPKASVIGENELNGSDDYEFVVTPIEPRPTTKDSALEELAMLEALATTKQAEARAVVEAQGDIAVTNFLTVDEPSGADSAGYEAESRWSTSSTEKPESTADDLVSKRNKEKAARALLQARLMMNAKDKSRLPVLDEEQGTTEPFIIKSEPSVVDISSRVKAEAVSRALLETRLAIETKQKAWMNEDTSTKDVDLSLEENVLSGAESKGLGSFVASSSSPERAELVEPQLGSSFISKPVEYVVSSTATELSMDSTTETLASKKKAEASMRSLLEARLALDTRRRLSEAAEAVTRSSSPDATNMAPNTLSEENGSVVDAGGISMSNEPFDLPSVSSYSLATEATKEMPEASLSNTQPKKPVPFFVADTSRTEVPENARETDVSADAIDSNDESWESAVNMDFSSLEESKTSVMKFFEEAFRGISKSIHDASSFTFQLPDFRSYPESKEVDSPDLPELDTKGMTERIMKKMPVEDQATGAGGSSTWEAFQKAEQNWSRLKAYDPSKGGMPIPEFVVEEGSKGNPKCWTKLRKQQGQELDYDVVVCGGTLGIFFATALQLKGHRVCVVEAGKLRGREQEWNISMEELLELKKLGILTQEDIDAVVTTQFPACRSGFKNREVTPTKGGYFENGIGYECETPDVLNLGISPSILIDRVSKRFKELGGVLKEETRLQGVAVSYYMGSALDFGDSEEPVTTSLVIDCMGNASPISRQQRNGVKPDGICAVVGSCAAGYEKETNLIGDIIYTNTKIQDKGENGMLQYFWEAFPVGIGRNGIEPGTSDVKTTYMFTYMDANEKRPSLETLMEDYWKLLPKYQPSIKNPETDLDVKRVLFAYFPTYRESPLQPQWSRILAVGDASGIQSPLSFGGFGALTRHLDRISGAISEALDDDCLHKDELAEINAYTPNLSAAWMFQTAMSVRMGQKVNPDFINRLLATNFEVMDKMGLRTIKPFLQDVVRFDGLVGSLTGSFLADPAFMPEIVAHVGIPTLVEWMGHVGMMGIYGLLDTAVSPLLGPVVDRMSARERFQWRRRMESWKFGSGNDYVLPE